MILVFLAWRTRMKQIKLHPVYFNNILPFTATSYKSFLHSRVSDWPPMWSSAQSSCLQIQRSVFDSRRYQIFWEILGLERSSLILVRIIEELFQENGVLRSRKPKLTTVGIRCTDHPLSTKVGTTFADKRQSLGRPVYFACGLQPRSFLGFGLCFWCTSHPPMRSALNV
jgi:hypothetical protein